MIKGFVWLDPLVQESARLAGPVIDQHELPGQNNFLRRSKNFG
jgi:hypothetical protein